MRRRCRGRRAAGRDRTAGRCGARRRRPRAWSDRRWVWSRRPSVRPRLPGDDLAPDAEPARGDQARGGRGCLGAEAALLDGDRDDDAGVIGARDVLDPTDVPRLVELDAVVEGLCRAGLAEDGQAVLRPARPDVGRGAAGRAGGQVQSVEHRLARLGIELDPARRAGLDALDEAAGRVVDLETEVRARHAAVHGDGRVRDGHLQRRGLDVALADREVDVVAHRPLAHVGDAATLRRGGVDRVLRAERNVLLVPAGRLAPGDALAPVPVGDEPRVLARQVDAGPAADAEVARHVLDDLGVRGVRGDADGVEVDVGRDLDRIAQVDRPVGRLAGVAALLRADVDATAVGDRVGRGDVAGAHGGQRRDRLERRPRRIQALQRAVEQRRTVGLGVELLVLRERDRLGEERRVERGLGAHRVDLAALRVHGHERAGPRGVAVGIRQPDGALQSLLALLLQPEVERELDLAARDGSAPRAGELADEVAEGVDLEHARAVAAAEVAVVGVLDAVLADDRALMDVAELRLLELARRDLTHVAQQLRGDVVVRVAAQVDRLRDDPRVRGLPLLEEVEHRARDVDTQRDRRVRQHGQRADHALLDRGRAHVDDATERREPTVQTRECGGLRRQRCRRLRVPRAVTGVVGAQPRPLHAAGLLPPPGGRVALGLRQRPRVDLYDIGQAAVDDRLPAAVHDVTARRLDALVAHTVLVGVGDVLVAGQHLQVPQAEEDDREQRERDEAQAGHAQRELRRDRRAAVLGLVVGHYAFWSGERPPVV